MNLFGRGQVTQEQQAEFERRINARMATQESVIRALETEQLDLHAQVKAWMRRAVAAERRTGERTTAPVAHPPRQGAPVRRLPMWGAGARIASENLPDEFIDHGSIRVVDRERGAGDVEVHEGPGTGAGDPDGLGTAREGAGG